MNNFKVNQHTISSGRLVAFGLAIVLALVATGCKSNQPAPIVNSDNGSDPAAGNLAPANEQPAQVLGSSSSYATQQQGESYPEGQQAPAPIVQGYSNGDNTDPSYSYNAPPSDESSQQYDYAQQAPPPLPQYDQPPAPDPNYIWTPGYWAYGPGGYYWVPGAWVAPPYYGALWTPPYWGYYGGRYAYHHGYWGPHVGFYGGVDYGFGYIGIGFFGGYWQGHDFYYNRRVTNVGHVHNVYDREVVYNNTNYGARPENRVSYNGGRGGVNVRPRPAEVVAMHEPHAAPIGEQVQLRQSAAQNHQQLYSANNGRPAQAAAERPIANVHAIAPPPHEVQQIQQRSAEAQQRNQQQVQQRQQQAQPRTQPDQRQQPEQGQQRQQPAQQQLQQRQLQQDQHQQVPQQQQRQQPEQHQQAPQQQQHQAQQPAAQAERPFQRPQPPVMTQRPQAAPNVQQPQPRPAEARPAPVSRPAPEARPAPQQARPAPAPHPAPEARPAPAAAPHAEAPHEAPHPEGDHPHR